MLALAKKAKNEIRLQFSGYAIFFAKLLSVATGFVFQVMLRGAIGEAYGIYFNMGDVIGYFILMSSVVPFWVMRYVARGKEGAVKTGLATNLIISVIGTVSYLALIPLILPSFFSQTANYLPIYLLAGFQIAEYYTINLFEVCLQASKPQAVGYGLLVQQVSKISAGYVLIVLFGQGLLGAVIVLIASFAIQIAYYGNLLSNQLKQRIQWSYVTEWFKGSVANIYNVVGNQASAFGLILLFIYGTETARGIYAAAAIIANIIAYSSFLSFALYPKLLAERNREDATTSLKMVLMFALPMAAGAIALADSYMNLLDYGYASLVLIILAIDALITVLGGLFNAVVLGTDTFDQDQKMSFKQLIRSKLFLAFSLPYVQATVSLPVMYYILTGFAFHQALEAAVYVALITMAVHVFTFSLLYLISRKMIRVSIPWVSIGKYLLASAILGVLLFVLPHPTTKLLTLAETALGGLIYLGLLLVVDAESRELPRAILKEIQVRLKAIR